MHGGGEHVLEPVDADPVGLQVDHPHVRAAVAQVQQRAVVGRRLDDHGVAGLHEQLEQERVGLHRAVGHEHLLDLDAVLLRDPLAQRHVADRRAVRRRPGRVVVERELRGLAQALDVDDVERRRPTGEGDRGHGRQTSGVWITSPALSTPSPAGASRPHPSRAGARPGALRGRVGRVHRADGGQPPFHHPRYAGQMLKPPHPVAIAAYTAAMHVNANNHALDGGPATSAMELEVMAWLTEMFGLPAEALGHLTSSGTIANLEALWVARELHPGKAVIYGANAHYTHGRMCAVLGIESFAVPAGRRRPDRPRHRREAVRDGGHRDRRGDRGNDRGARSTTSRGRRRCASATACGCTSTRPTAGSSRCSRARAR